VRFFFDFTQAQKNHSLNDYEGVEFRTFQSARDYADAITSQMRNSLSGEWIGWRVDVRNADGRKFFSMPVRAVAPKLCAVAPG
jgi:hypothetical protein